MRPQNLVTLTFDLSRSPQGKCDAAIGLLIYGFLLMVKGIIGPI